MKYRHYKFGVLGNDESGWIAAKRLGWDRIWDCGKVKWVLKMKEPPT